MTTPQDRLAEIGTDDWYDEAWQSFEYVSDDVAWLIARVRELEARNVVLWHEREGLRAEVTRYETGEQEMRIIELEADAEQFRKQALSTAHAALERIAELEQESADCGFDQGAANKCIAELEAENAELEKDLKRHLKNFIHADECLRRITRVKDKRIAELEAENKEHVAEIERLEELLRGWNESASAYGFTCHNKDCSGLLKPTTDCECKECGTVWS